MSRVNQGRASQVLATRQRKQPFALTSHVCDTGQIMDRQRILRHRLVSLVDQRWQGGLTLTVGGPGMGKSTLVNQAMTESEMLARGQEWLIRCGRGWDAAQLEVGFRRSIPGLEEVDARRLVELLWTHAPHGIGLVVDDAHELDDSGIDMLVEIRRQLPSNAHLWVIGRDLPRFVARFMTADPVLVINEEALLFDDPELSAFASVSQLKPSTLANAGGWPALLALCASAGDAVASAYLYDSVLAGLSQQQQGDLAVAAALGEIDAALTGRVLRGTATSLAAVPLVDLLPGGGIAVHELWRDPTSGLVDRERLDDAARLTAAHAERLGDVDHAASVLHHGALHDDARRLMIRHIAAGADRVPLDRVQRWLGLATAPTDGLLRQTLQLLRSGLVDGTIDPQRLESLSDRCRLAGEFDLEALVAQMRFAIAWSADDVDACQAIADRLIELDIAHIMSSSQARAMKEITTARASLDHVAVIERIRAARAEHGDVPGLDWNLPLELETLIRLGRPHAALARLEGLDEQHAAQKVRSVTYGLTYWFCGRPLEAIRAIDSLLELPGRFRGIDYSWRSTSEFFRAWSLHGSGDAADLVEQRAGDLGSMTAGARPLSAYSQVCHGLTEIGQLINSGQEAEAAAAMDRLASLVPPTSGLAMHAWFVGAAAWYLLRPDDRPMLDAFMVDDLFAEANALFRAFLAGRDTGTVPADLIASFPPPATIGTVMPARWAAELALRLPASQASLCDAVFDTLPERGRPLIDAIAESSSSDARLKAAASDRRAASPHPPKQPVVISLCGQPQLDTGANGGAAEWRRGRVRALFGLLALRGPRTREAAIDIVWPDLDSAAGRRNLRVTLSYLSRALEPDRPRNTPPWFIRAENDTIALHHEALTIDVVTIRAELARAAHAEQQGLASQTIAALEAACSNYRGPLLVGLDDPWIEQERATLARQVHAAALRLSALQLARGITDAVRWAELAIEIDPWSLPALQARVDALDRQGSPEVEDARDRLALLTNELGAN